MNAARNNNTEVAKLLIAADANVNARDKFSCTALLWASKYGYIEFAKILIAAGADVNTKNNYIGWTSLMLAVQNGHIGLANLLIDSGAKVSISLIFKINHPNLYKTAVIGSATILGLGINYLIKRL
jgi:ankyrin repeat protein